MKGELLLPLIEVLSQVSRAGGGGSSSGGGGGGLALIILIGYLPSHYLGLFIKRRFDRRTELIISSVGAGLSSLVICILTLVITPELILISLLVILGIWIGWTTAFFGIWERLLKQSKQVRLRIKRSGEVDPAWNESSMLETAKQIFVRYQEDWSAFRTENIRTYTTSRYAAHAALLLMALRQLGRTNRMSNVKIHQALIVNAIDAEDNTFDTFEVAFEASALDELVDATGKVIFTDKKRFIEYWRFVRSADGWLLDNITQQTQNRLAAMSTLQDFAAANNMYYSLDTGWLLLPTDGLLMKRGRLGTADINNHTIGLYNNLLVQLYTFTPVVRRRGTDNWLVLQIVLPRSYGGIIIQERKKFGLFSLQYNKPPRSYSKYTFEWQDFNDRYDVDASDRDRLSTFELLNPGFMADLYDSNLQITIEVRDSVLYLYRYLGQRNDANMLQGEYASMLKIAQKAFKELKL